METKKRAKKSFYGIQWRGKISEKRILIKVI